MIPGNIQKKHIIEAIQQLDKQGMPKNRVSKKFDLVWNEKTYPPKYLISLANEIVNKEPLDPEQYSGGNESNNFLMRLGFSIIDKEKNASVVPEKQEELFFSVLRQNEHANTGRCSECKNTIMEMLSRIYGLVKVEHKFMLSTKIEAYEGFACYPHLKKVFDALESFRGYTNFNRTSTLKPCDMYVVEKDFVAEIDEPQHFSLARAVSLEAYPSALKTAFPVQKWIQLCKTIRSVDNDPVFRDEQRAWYDALRDFLPLIDGFMPTMRIYTSDYEWCSLNPKDTGDQHTFINLVRGNV